MSTRTDQARVFAREARTNLELLADEMDALATELDQSPEGSAAASTCIGCARQARGAARMLVDWEGNLQRLRVPGVDVE